MLSTVTIDDATAAAVVLHSDTSASKRLLISAAGLVGSSPVRDSKRIRPSAHGAINETRWGDGSSISLVGEVISTVGIEDCFAEFRAIMLPLVQTLDVGPALLKWTEGATGLQLQKAVKLDSDVTPTLAEGAAIINYQVALFSEDPRAYAQAQTTVTSSNLTTASGGLTFGLRFPFIFNQSGGGTITATNAGNRSTPPLFRIFGGCTNPQIVLVGSGLRISVVGTIAAGDFLDVDVATRTLKLNGTTLRQNFLDPVNTTWFDLAPGASNLQLVAGTFDGTAALTTIFRSAYA